MWIYKDRVLPSDAVEFLFTTELVGQTQMVSNLPVLSYSPALDMVSLIATALVAFSVLIILENHPRLVGRLRRPFRDLQPTQEG